MKRRASKRTSRLRLTAMNRKVRSSEDSPLSVETPSDASFRDDTDAVISQADIKRCTTAFKRQFPWSTLRRDGLVKLRDTRGVLHASRIKNPLCMHPALIKSILRPGSLDQIIHELRTLRGDTHGAIEDLKCRQLL